MGKAEDRARLEVPYHLFQIDRDLDDGERRFASLERHFDEKVEELRVHFDKRSDESDARVRRLTTAAIGVFLSLLTTSITLLLNVVKP